MKPSHKAAELAQSLIHFYEDNWWTNKGFCVTSDGLIVSNPLQADIVKWSLSGAVCNIFGYQTVIDLYKDKAFIELDRYCNYINGISLATFNRHSTLTVILNFLNLTIAMMEE